MTTTRRRPAEREAAPLRITIPIPPPECSPNGAGHCHWAVKRRANESAARDADIATKQALREGGPLPNAETYNVRIVWIYGKGQKSRDADNMLATLKAAIDSISAAIGINDKRFRFPPIETARDKGRGSVTLELTPEVR